MMSIRRAILHSFGTELALSLFGASFDGQASLLHTSTEQG